MFAGCETIAWAPLRGPIFPPDPPETVLRIVDDRLTVSETERFRSVRSKTQNSVGAQWEFYDVRLKRTGSVSSVSENQGEDTCLKIPVYMVPE